MWGGLPLVLPFFPVLGGYYLAFAPLKRKIYNLCYSPFSLTQWGGLLREVCEHGTSPLVTCT
jgi:hypothetical protein